MSLRSDLLRSVFVKPNAPCQSCYCVFHSLDTSAHALMIKYIENEWIPLLEGVLKSTVQYFVVNVVVLACNSKLFSLHFIVVSKFLFFTYNPCKLTSFYGGILGKVN